MDAKQKTEDNRDILPAWLELVRRQVTSLRFGVVQIVVHDSEIAQIDKTERVRLPKTESRIF